MNEFTYAIINKEDILGIDWFTVYETNPSTLRYSLDGSKTFVKFSGDLPHSIQLIHKGLYTHEGILELMKTDEWISDVSE